MFLTNHIAQIAEISEKKAAVKVVAIHMPFLEHITYALFDVELKFVGAERETAHSKYCMVGHEKPKSAKRVTKCV